MSSVGDRRVWTVQEDNAIRQLVMKYGTRSWSVIAEHIVQDFNIDGRTGKQCRERWHNHLDPHINKEAWTEEEERIMADAHKTLGCLFHICLLYTSPSPRDATLSRMPSSA